MALKKHYEQSIKLQCLTCSADYAFETDEISGIITCRKCGRKYMGGKEELMHVNEKLIKDGQDAMINEVRSDIIKEFKQMFKRIK